MKRDGNKMECAEGFDCLSSLNTIGESARPASRTSAPKVRARMCLLSQDKDTRERQMRHTCDCPLYHETATEFFHFEEEIVRPRQMRSEERNVTEEIITAPLVPSFENLRGEDRGHAGRDEPTYRLSKIQFNSIQSLCWREIDARNE